MKSIILATTNKAKEKYFRAMLGEYPLSIVDVSEEERPHISEDLFDIKGNAVKKATVYASKFNFPAIADDTGFFIPALDDMPGVAVRRWGGELPDDVSDDEWMRFFKEKIKGLDKDELTCIRRKVFCIALPDGRYLTMKDELVGEIRENLHPKFEKGGPLGSHFFVEKHDKFLSEMIDEGLGEPSLKKDLDKILTHLNII